MNGAPKQVENVAVGLDADLRARQLGRVAGQEVVGGLRGSGG